jgi:intein/homing endonuclease
MSKRFERNVIKFLEMLHYSEDPGSTGKFKKRYCKSEGEYKHLIDYLEREELIRAGFFNKVKIIQLTDEGIKFLQEIKKEKRQQEFNRIIAFTASILALIGIYDFLNKLNIIDKTNWLTWIFVVFVIIAIAPIAKFLIDSYLE